MSRRLESILSHLQPPPLSLTSAPTVKPFSYPSLKDKICLVTGAGSGVGRAVAIGLAEQGATIILAGRREDQLKETAKLIKEKSSTVSILTVPTDVSQPKQVSALFHKIGTKFGRLDVLFNNAGMGAPAVPLEDLPYETWENVVGVNLTGVFLCTQEAFKIMKKQNPKGGRIINNGSISADRPRPNSLPYTTTKHGVTGLTKAASLDGRKYDIAVGQIDIGNAETPLTQRMKSGVLQPDGKMAPEPVMEITNVSNAVIYMASLPLDANVLFLTVMATKMPYIGRG